MKKKITFVSILYGILFSILIVIVLGTIIVFAKQQAIPGKNLREVEYKPTKLPDDIGIFAEINQIRARPKSSNNQETAVTIIIQPWFSYEKSDNVFEEELYDKRKKIQNIFTEYFASKTYEEIKQAGEGLIKQELLLLINSQLIMGKISAIYFEEYLFLE